MSYAEVRNVGVVDRRWVWLLQVFTCCVAAEALMTGCLGFYTRAQWNKVSYGDHIKSRRLLAKQILMPPPFPLPDYTFIATYHLFNPLRNECCLCTCHTNFSWTCCHQQRWKFTAEQLPPAPSSAREGRGYEGGGHTREKAHAAHQQHFRGR